MKKLVILTFKILYFLFATICTIFIVGNMFVITMHSSFTSNGFDLQVILFLILSLLILIILWFLIFIKIPIAKKIIIFIICLVCLFLIQYFPSIQKIFDMDYCIDVGVCKEGLLEMQDNKGNAIPITKENCIKYGYKWIEQEKSCNLRK